MVKVIATDLDGTLFYPKRRISMIAKKNKKFLYRFIDDGGKLALVSSRSDNFRKKIAKHFDRPFDFIGAEGCFITIDDQMKEETFFPQDLLRELIPYIREKYAPWIFMLTSKNRPFVVARSGVKRIVTAIYFLYMFFQGAYKEKGVRSDYVFFDEINKGEVYKLMLFVGFTKKQKLMSKKLCEEINAKYDSIEAHWLGEVAEITPKGCTKAEGLAKYLDYLKINHDNVLVVGDGGNDVPMFDRFHEHSYAMSHAHLSVKSHASATIKHFHDLEDELYPSVDRKSSKKN